MLVNNAERMQTKRSWPDSDVIGYVVTITQPLCCLLVPASHRYQCRSGVPANKLGVKSGHRVSL